MSTTSAPVTTAPSLVFTPQAAAQNLIVTNKGSSTVFLGQSGVTAATGFPLCAGQQISLPKVAQSVYAVAAPGSTKSPTSVVGTGGVAQGGTAIPVASGGASFTQGMVLVIQDGNNTELVTVGAGSTGTSVVISAAAFAHAAGVAFGQLAASNGSVLSVVTGSGN